MKRLKRTEHVVTAWAASAAGPGWANSPVWVLIRDMADGSHRTECLQPDEQTDEIRLLYQFSALAHCQMTAAVERMRRTEET